MSIYDPNDMAGRGLPRVALIAGPTASGKSARALELAEREGGTIINADASQVYRDLRILTARPSEEEEARVPHRLFGYRDAAEAHSAAQWAAAARAAIAEAHGAGRLPILVGGTGLYIRTLIEGIAPIPDIDPAVRDAVRALPTDQASALLAREDPKAAATLHPHDRSRIQRALEVIRSTGRSIVDWRDSRSGGIGGDYAIEVEQVVLDVPELYARCDRRVEAMIAAGAIEEVAALLARRLPDDLPAMRSIGVPQLAQYLSGEVPLSAAIDRIKQATRNYAKRQRTWLRHQLLCGAQ